MAALPLLRFVLLPLFPFDDFLYLAQFVEGFEGGEVVDVDAEYLVAHLCQHGVVELEDVHLQPFAAVGDGGGGSADGAVALLLLHLVQDVLGTLDDALGHAGHAGDVDAEGVLAAALDELAQEDDLLVDLAHGDVVVAHAGQRAGHVVELVVVGGEEGAGMAAGVLVDVLDDGPGDGDAVVGAGAAAELVEEHKAAGAEVVEDVAGLGHLDHEGGLADGDVVGGTDAGEDLVDEAYAGAVGGHEAAHLCQQGDEGGLAQQGALAGHVGSGDDDDLLLVGVEVDVVGDVVLAHGHLLLDDGMAALTDVEDEAVVDDGSDVAVLLGHGGEGEEAVEAGYLAGVDLYGGDVAHEVGDEVAEETGFEGEDLVLGTEDALLVLLQLLGDVPLGVDECLLAYPLGGHLVLVGVADLDVVAEDVVVGYLERGYAGGLGLALLHLQEVVLAAVGYLAELVELVADAAGDDAGPSAGDGGIGGYLAGYAVADVGTDVELAADGAEVGVVGLQAGVADGLEGGEGEAQLLHLTRVDASHGDLADDAFEVADLAEVVVEMLLCAENEDVWLNTY